MIVEIFTDGSADNVESRVGGWAALLRFGDKEKVIAGSELDTTSIRMELTAAAEALESLLRPCGVRLSTDSEFLVKGVTGQHKRLTANADLWARILEQKARHEIEWVWVKGHAGVSENELVHNLAIGEFRKRVKAEQERKPAQVFDFREAQQKVREASEGWPEVSLECERRYSDGDPAMSTYYRLKPFISDYGDPDAPRVIARGRKGVLLNVLGEWARIVFDDAPPAEHLSTTRKRVPASEEIPATQVRPLGYTSQKKGVS